MTSDEDRARWHRQAIWITQLGLSTDETAPAELADELAKAVLALLDEVANLENDRYEARRIGTWLYDHSPGVRLYLGNTSEWPWLTADPARNGDSVPDPEDAASSTPMAAATDFVDHDHTAEAAFLDYLASPTADTAHAAELSIALLQRRYDALLRRLDGDAVPPLTPAHTHNAWDMPEACLDGSLTDLAEGSLEDRAATLAHGHEALRALVHHIDEARRYARLLYQRVMFGVVDYDALEVPMDVDAWPAWLTYYDADAPEQQRPED